MADAPLVFLDSGIGGLPYLTWIADTGISRRLVYVADTRHFPYGELAEDEVKRAVVETAGRIFSELKPALLTIACNTASVAALEEVRHIATCPVVGTVPAVKPAAEEKGRIIGVLATEGTVASPYLDNLVEAFASHREVRRQAAGDIVRYVEERWLDEGDDGAVPVMLPALEKLKSENVDSLVIGCTHFLHVLPTISDIMGPGVRMIDSRDGVGRRILHLLGHSDGNCDGTMEGQFLVTQSGGSDGMYRRFARQYGLNWGGELP